jgi:protein-disulfide isomerase
MAAMRPTVRGGPSRRSILAAFAIAVGATVAVVGLALVARDKQTPDAVQAPVVNLAGIPQDGSVLGRRAARVTLIEYADQQCPGCRYYALNVFPVLVQRFVRPGKVKMEYRGFPFIGPDSVKALRFLLAAGLQNRLWQLQEALFRHQGRENGGWVTDDLIRELGAEIPGIDVDRLFADAESEPIRVSADKAEPAATAAGVPGTPTFFIKIGNAKPYSLQLTPSTNTADYFTAALNDALRS